MDTLNEILISYGYWGMGIAAFLAGTIIPFSSEVVMAALLATSSMDPFLTVLSGTIGNVAGSMVNYWIGTIGNMKIINKYLGIKEERIQKTQRFLEGKGAWMGVLSFLPVVGEAISIVLGIMRANPTIVLISTFLGKFGRYLIIAYSVEAFK